MTIKTTIFTHCPCVSLTRFLFCWWHHNQLLMTSQWPDNYDMVMWIVISISHILVCLTSERYAEWQIQCWDGSNAVNKSTQLTLWTVYSRCSTRIPFVCSLVQSMLMHTNVSWQLRAPVKQTTPFPPSINDQLNMRCYGCDYTNPLLWKKLQGSWPTLTCPFFWIKMLSVSHSMEMGV